MSNLSKIFPTNIGIIHFIGIGGIGMSGIAEILLEMGYQVQGSDLNFTYVTERLESLGIKIFYNHNALNVENASIVVHSTAIKEDNPEMLRAVSLSIPIIKRSEMLAELMRFKAAIAISGTHGKTTTTSLVACLLEEASLNPTVINGGIINSRQTNAYLGAGSFLVVEADESDGTFIKIPSYAGIITNINPEHLDYYKTFENSISAYRQFIVNLPFYGFGVMCYDHPIVRQLGHSIKERKIISYGIESSNVDLKAINIRSTPNGNTFDIIISDVYRKRRLLEFNEIKNIALNLYGKHNVSNALAAIAVGLEIGIAPDIIQNAFANFAGVKRRFTKVGVVNEITIIDDYAHHPNEIMAVLNTAKEVIQAGRIIAVVQPHRYSRLKELIDEFSEAFYCADLVIIADVFSAGEEPIPEINAITLIERIKKINPNKEVYYLKDPSTLATLIYKLAKSQDYVICMGAGNITKWTYELPKQLDSLYTNNI